MLHFRRPKDRPLLKRLLDPSWRTLFAVASLAFAGAIWYGQPYAWFLVRGSMGEAEIIAVEPEGDTYARYRVRLDGEGARIPETMRGAMPESVIQSDRRALQVGDRITVLYRRDFPRRMAAVELFAPWTRSLWLIIAALAALGLGLRERERERTQKVSQQNCPDDQSQDRG